MSDQERTPEEAALEANLGVRFSDLSLLRLALTHRSYAFELGLPHDNERLEFLGDSILGVTITSEIYNRLPEAREGRLAKIRAATVSTKSLAKVAHLIDLGQAVRLGVGERKTGGSTKPSILADTMEAVIGALYLDQGLDAVRPVILSLFEPLLRDIATRNASLDYKTSLQELVAATQPEQPTYEISETGPDHEKEFTATVVINGEALGWGVGPSKKQAEQIAAAQAYKTLSTRLQGDSQE